MASAPVDEQDAAGLGLAIAQGRGDDALAALDAEVSIASLAVAMLDSERAHQGGRGSDKLGCCRERVLMQLVGGACGVAC